MDSFGTVMSKASSQEEQQAQKAEIQEVSHTTMYGPVHQQALCDSTERWFTMACNQLGTTESFHGEPSCQDERDRQGQGLAE